MQTESLTDPSAAAWETVRSLRLPCRFWPTAAFGTVPSDREAGIVDSVGRSRLFAELSGRPQRLRSQPSRVNRELSHGVARRRIPIVIDRLR